MVVSFAFYTPAIVIYHDVKEHQIRDCYVVSATPNFHKNGCTRTTYCDDDGYCEEEDYDCWTITYVVNFTIDDELHHASFKGEDDFESESNARSRANNWRSPSNTYKCLVNPNPEGDVQPYTVSWDDKVDNTAWIVLFIFGGLCSLPIVAAIGLGLYYYAGIYECIDDLKDKIESFRESQNPATDSHVSPSTIQNRVIAGDDAEMEEVDFSTSSSDVYGDDDL